MNRRDALWRLLQLAAVALVPAGRGSRALAGAPRNASAPDGAPASPPLPIDGSPRGKLAIIGGGMGGLGTAWLCDPSWDVELFEARPKLGGHCDTEIVDVGGQPLHVDLGAQFFHPDTHPLYLCLLEELGLFDRHGADTRASVEARATLSFFSVPDGRVDFVSSQPLHHLIRALDFAIYTQAARKAVLKHVPFETTVDEWVGGLHLPASFRTDRKSTR